MLGLKWLCIDKVTRYLKNRRISGVGSYKNVPAFIKIFYAKSKASKEFEKETSAATSLAAHQISTPNILASGEKSGIYWIAFVLIDNAKSFSEEWTCLRSQGNNSEATIQFDRLLSLNTAIFRQGLMQTDPHLDNFLVSTSLVYAVDAGGIRRANKRSTQKRL